MTFSDRLFYAMRGRGPMPTDAIYSAFKRRYGKPSRHWRATVRNTLQRGCRASPKFMGRARFKHIDRGVWECR